MFRCARFTEKATPDGWLRRKPRTKAGFRRCLRFIAASLFVCFPYLADAQPVYTFKKIVDTTGDFDGFGDPVINDHGTVGIYARFDDGHHGVFIADSAGLTAVAEENGSIIRLGEPSINNKGKVAFGAISGGVESIRIGDSTRVDTVVDTTGPFSALSHALNPGQFGSFDFVPINDNDVVAFRGKLGTGQQGIYRTDGVAVTKIADQSDGFLGFGFSPASLEGQSHDLNDHGEVAFSARQDNGRYAAFIGDGSALRLVADSTGTLSTIGVSAINNFSVVAFNAAIGVANTGIFMTDGTSTTLVVDTDGPYVTFNRPDINGQNQVVFSANSSLHGGAQHIVVSSREEIHNVISRGDELDGSIVNALGLSRQSVNELGQIAFWASFLDEREPIGFRVGLYVATPVRDNEIASPSTLVLFAASLASLVLLQAVVARTP